MYRQRHQKNSSELATKDAYTTDPSGHFYSVVKSLPRLLARLAFFAIFGLMNKMQSNKCFFRIISSSYPLELLLLFSAKSFPGKSFEKN